MASPSFLPRSSRSRSFRALVATHHFQHQAPLDQVLQQCTVFQQSLSSLWHSACDSAADSLQQLQTNRKTLAQLIPWRVTGKYLQSRDEGSRQGRWQEESEDEFLLGEIRRFLSPEPAHASDTLLLETPRTPRPQAFTPSPKISALNKFIQEKRRKYEAKPSLLTERKRVPQMERISPSAEVQRRARQLVHQRERHLKDLRLKRLLAHQPEHEREEQRLFQAVKREAQDVRTKATIEGIYRGSKTRKQIMA